ncbi:glycosyltransferase family 2 protein [Brachyspira pilosicoli]
MSMIKLSIVIPIYNVEKYLEDCLNSVINQTLKEIEIICVDDCSTDNSFTILEEFAKKDDRIKVLKHDINRGLGPARNTGIKASQGEYVGFIDSDDYVSKDYFENLYNTAKKYNSDITNTLNILTDTESVIKKYDYNIINYLSRKESRNINLYVEGKSDISIIDEKENTKEYPFVVAWNKIYKREFLINNELYFMEIKSGSEDEDFYQRILLNEPSTSYNHKSIYYYRQRASSLIYTYNKNIDFVKNNIALMNNSINYYKEKRRIDLLPFLYNRTCRIILETFNKTIYKEENYEIIYNFIEEISKNIDFIKLVEKSYYYRDYLCILSSSKYKNYALINILLEDINNLKYKLNELEYNINNKFRLFHIENKTKYIIITIFGIKISIKR